MHRQKRKGVGTGVHPKAGSAHAEIIAISQAKQTHGAAALKGSTLYVTLEPCNHTGRTPPCTTGILEAGISRVVIGARDPNTQVEEKASNS